MEARLYAWKDVSNYIDTLILTFDGQGAGIGDMLDKICDQSVFALK